MIVYEQGDCIKSDLPNHICFHGVNCVGAFSAGIARQIRDTYPIVYKLYMAKHRKPGWSLGDVQMVRMAPNEINPSCLYIANMATQHDVNIGGNRKVQVSYQALELCFKKLLEWCHQKRIEYVVGPKIGSGLAGGDWKRIESIINKELKSYPNIKIVVHTL